MCYRTSCTYLDTMLGKLAVKLFAWMREIPEPVAAPGLESAILIRSALRSKREMCTSVPRILAKNGYSVLEEGGYPSIGICIAAFVFLRAAVTI